MVISPGLLIDNRRVDHWPHANCLVAAETFDVFVQEGLPPCRSWRDSRWERLDTIVGHELLIPTRHRYFPIASREPSGTFHPHHSIILYEGAPISFTRELNLIKKATFEEFPVKNQIHMEMMQIWEGFMNSAARLPIEWLSGNLRGIHEVLSFLQGASFAMRHLYNVELRARAQVMRERATEKRPWA
jgi:hypothetical protein